MIREWEVGKMGRGNAGWRKSDGVPVEARGAETFWPMSPLLPIPVTTTRSWVPVAFIGSGEPPDQETRVDAAEGKVLDGRNGDLP